jgi:integrase
MASLKRQSGSKIYQAQFYVPDLVNGGLRQVRKTTGKTRKSEALLVAAELERAAQGVVKAGSDKAAQAKAILVEMAAEIDRETFTSLSARKHVARILGILTGEEMTAYTVESWIGEWLRRKERAKSSKATLARYKGHTEAFLAWLGDERRKKPLESVTSQDARKWRESLQDAGRAGKTVLAYMKDIGAVYRSAIAEGLVSFNPFNSLEAIDTSDSQERKPFTMEEVASLVEHATSEEWRGLVLVAAFTGLRLGDASKLSWDTVDLDTKKITLIPSKTKKKKKEVHIPIHPDLLAYLIAAPVAEDSPAAAVFPTLAKKKIGDRAGLSQTFNKLMAAAGVDRGKPSREIVEGQEAGVGRITYERGFHSLRHTFTSWLRNAGVSEEDRMQLTGHSTRESHSIYSHADEKAGRDAIAKLPSLNPKKSKP